MAIKSIFPNEALIQVGRLSLLFDIEAQDWIAGYFGELTQMVLNYIYYRLDYPRHYEELTRVREAILRHDMEDEGPAR